MVTKYLWTTLTPKFSQLFKSVKTSCIIFTLWHKCSMKLQNKSSYLLIGCIQTKVITKNCFEMAKRNHRVFLACPNLVVFAMFFFINLHSTKCNQQSAILKRNWMANSYPNILAQNLTMAIFFEQYHEKKTNVKWKRIGNNVWIGTYRY
jgi:hypothetical protein